MAAPAAVSTAQGAAGPGLRLGFDTYSVRAYGWKAIRLLDFAAEMKTDTIQFSDFPNFESTDAAYLQKVPVLTISPMADNWVVRALSTRILPDLASFSDFVATADSPTTFS